jgi:prepilin-type N-terminal cleavage/methylation domain-containing protein
MTVLRAGFTLVELLVTLAVMGIAVIYMLEGVTTSNRTYTMLEQVTESQQNLRAVAALIEHDLRHAGMMVPPGGALCGVDDTAGPDLLYVSDADAIDPQDDLMPYEGARITTAITNVTGSAATLALDTLVLEPAPPTRPAYDTDGDSTNDSDFQVGGGVIVFDANDPARGTVCGRIRVVNVGASSITVDPIVAAPLGSASGAVQLVAIPAHEYRVTNGDELRRDGLLLATGVEDLQLAYFFDVDGDGEVGAGEMRGATAADTYDAQDRDVTELRRVRFNLVARTRSEEEGFTGRFQATENRVAGVDDGFRRRVYTNTLLPRNMLERFGT